MRIEEPFQLKNPFSIKMLNQRRSQKRPTGFGYRLTHFPLFILWVLKGFWLGWKKSRPVKPFLWGIPAILFIIATLGLLAVILWHPPILKAPSYLQQARQAAGGRDYKKSDLFYRKLVHLGRQEPQVRYEAALVAEKRTHSPRARGMMEELARTENHVPARIWLAEDTLKNGALSESERLNKATEHLEAAIAREPDNLQALSILSNVYWTQHQPEKAIALLEKASVKSPELLLKLSAFYQATGNDDLLKQTARRAALLFEARLASSDLQSDPVHRSLLSESLLQLEDFQQAAATMTANPRQLRNDNARQLLARIYSRWAGGTKQSDSPATMHSFATQLTLLDQALQWSPTETEAIKELAATIQDDAATPELDNNISELLAVGQAASLCHIILGLRDEVAERKEQANLHFTQAMLLNPNVILTVGALGYHFATDETSQDQALARHCLKRLLSQTPHTSGQLFIAGQTLLAFGNTNDAIAHLEEALTLEKSPTIHQALARAYHEAGNIEKAKEHFDASNTPS